jgi:hypothetical protein
MALTPKSLEVFARFIALTIVLPLLVMTFIDRNGSAAGSMILGYFLVCSAMIGFPWVRRSDILSSISVLLFALELVSYGSRMPGTWPGLAGAVVGIFAALGPSYIRDFRSLAVRSEDIKLGELRKFNRRSGAALPVQDLRPTKIRTSNSDTMLQIPTARRIS